MSRIYDDPNHPHYGRVRRCWIVLVGMFPDMTTLDREYLAECGWQWDEQIAYYAVNGVGEAAALRHVVGRALGVYPE